MSDLPFDLEPALAARLRDALDVERKLVRALDALGPLAGRDVALVGVPDGLHATRLREAGVRPRLLPLDSLPQMALPDASVDAVVSMWSAFRGVNAAEVAEADRVLRPAGRLLVVHDYGRDDVCALRARDAPEYVSWSRREGPFLCGGEFKIRVVHAFWTFADMDAARGFLVDAFADRGEAVASTLRRPRLSWNVAIYHRWRGGRAPEEASAGMTSPDASPAGG